MGHEGGDGKLTERCHTSASLPGSTPGSVRSLRVSTPPAPQEAAAFRSSFSSTSGSDASQLPQQLRQNHWRPEARPLHTSRHRCVDASSEAQHSSRSRWHLERRTDSSDASVDAQPWSERREVQPRSQACAQHSFLVAQRDPVTQCDPATRQHLQDAWSGHNSGYQAPGSGLPNCKARPFSAASGCAARPNSAASCIQCPDSEAKLVAARDAVVDLLSRLTEATEERDEAVEQAHREWQLAELLRQRLASSPGSQDANLAANGGRLPSNLRSSRIGHLQSPQTTPLKPPQQLQQNGEGQTSHQGSPARTGSAEPEHLCSQHQVHQADLLQQPSCEMEIGESDCCSNSNSRCASPVLGMSSFSSTTSVISPGVPLPHWLQLARQQQHRQNKQLLKHDNMGNFSHSGVTQRDQQSSGRLQGSRLSLDVRQVQSSPEPVRRSVTARRPLLPQPRPLPQHAAALLRQDRDLLAEAQERAATLEERLKQSDAVILQLLGSAAAGVPAASSLIPQLAAQANMQNAMADLVASNVMCSGTTTPAAASATSSATSAASHSYHQQPPTRNIAAKIHGRSNLIRSAFNNTGNGRGASVESLRAYARVSPAAGKAAAAQSRSALAAASADMRAALRMLVHFQEQALPPHSSPYRPPRLLGVDRGSDRSNAAGPWGGAH